MTESGRWCGLTKHRLVILAGVLAAAGSVYAAPSSGGVTPVRMYKVVCPSTRATSFPCTTTGASGPVDAQLRRLSLSLPRQYAAVALRCRATVPDRGIACRAVAVTRAAAPGTRVVVLALPNPFEVVRVSCGTGTSRAFACQADAPMLRLRSLHPFSVRGTHFLPLERVHVTLTGSWVVDVQADGNGAFVATFAGVNVDVCDGYVVRAEGSKGSAAVLRSLPRECPSRMPG